MKPEEVKVPDVVKALFQTCQVFVEWGVSTQTTTDGLIAASLVVASGLMDDVGDKIHGEHNGVEFKFERTQEKK